MFTEQFFLGKGKPQKERSLDKKQKEVFEIIEKIKKLKSTARTPEDWKEIIETLRMIDEIYKPKKGWQLEGKLTRENVLVEYHVEGEGGVYAANFSPKGDRVVIGSSDIVRGNGVIQVLSLTEKDEKGKPKVLVEYETRGLVLTANFSSEGNMIVIEGEGKVLIGEKK